MKLLHAGFVFVEPACGEFDIIVLFCTSVRCFCMRTCGRPSGLVCSGHYFYIEGNTCTLNYHRICVHLIVCSICRTYNGGF